MLLPGEGDSNISETQKGQQGGQWVWSLETYGDEPPWTCAGFVHWHSQRRAWLRDEAFISGLLLGRNEAQAARKKTKQTSLELGLIGSVLVQNIVHHTNHHNCPWGREGALVFG